MREVRAGLSMEERSRRAERIVERLFRVGAFAQARTVFLFSSFGAEVSTRAIAERLIEEGRRVLLPVLDKTVMHAAEYRPDEGLLGSWYGPDEPADRTPVDPAEIDAIVVPGLAFDRRGFRVGYGGGHYDRYLRSLGDRATRVGVAFEVQLVEHVPRGRFDQPVDVVVTEEETIFCHRPPTEATASST
jgi:5-formyltetrahydrofolate cyclo-ligase